MSVYQVILADMLKTSVYCMVWVKNNQEWCQFNKLCCQICCHQVYIVWYGLKIIKSDVSLFLFTIIFLRQGGTKNLRAYTSMSAISIYQYYCYTSHNSPPSSRHLFKNPSAPLLCPKGPRPCLSCSLIKKSY